MMAELELYVSCDGDWVKPEVQISGSIDSLRKFGESLNSLTEHLVRDLPLLESEYYPVSIKTIEINLESLGNDLIAIKVDKDNLKLKGTEVAYNKLGDSLLNFFDTNSNIGDHFQLDYYESNQVLDKTDCHLVFMCDR